MTVGIVEFAVWVGIASTLCFLMGMFTGRVIGADKTFRLCFMTFLEIANDRKVVTDDKTRERLKEEFKSLIPEPRRWNSPK